MQILNQYIKHNVLLNFNRISMFIKVYLINKLQFKLIININVFNRGNIDLLLNHQALKVKDTEISLCYTPSPPALVNRINSMFSFNNYEEKYYFYHFNTYTNNDNVITPKTRKQKFKSTLLHNLQTLQNSVNYITNQLFITSTTNESKNSILNLVKCFKIYATAISFRFLR